MLQAVQFDAVDAQGVSTSLLSPELQAGIPLAYPDLQASGTYALTTLTLDTSNTRLGDVISAMPRRLIWNFDALTHPDGDETHTGFVLDTSRIGITLRAELPLYGKAGQIPFQQSFDMDLSELETGPLETADLKLWIDNGFPLESAVQAYFLDETGQVLDSLFEDGATWIGGAAVDVSGRAVAPTQTDVHIRLNAQRVAVLRDARQIAVRCLFATSEGGTIPVAMYADYQIGIRLGVLAGL
jgi:hypothetical protein